jgi:hypothetical protein
MLVRWMRKVLVLGLAALGVQYLRMIARVILDELRPRSVASRSSYDTHRAIDEPSVAPRRLVLTTLEPHGAL